MGEDLRGVDGLMGEGILGGHCVLVMKVSATRLRDGMDNGDGQDGFGMLPGWMGREWKQVVLVLDMTLEWRFDAAMVESGHG